VAQKQRGVSSPGSVASFIAALPAPRRVEFERVREVLRAAIPAGYEEVISKRMLVYQVPLARYPDTFNGYPSWYVALASEKSYLSLHLMSVYGSPLLMQELADGFRAAGKRLDMGKACVRFRSADDLALTVIRDIVARLPVERWIEIARAAQRR
jgi:hypothetical protein